MLLRFDGPAGEGGGFVEVGCDEERFGEERAEERIDGFGGDERRAVFADHDGVNDKRRIADGVGNGFDNCRGAEGAGLGGVGRDIFENGVDLLADEFGIEQFDAGDGLGVLDGDEGEDGFAVDTELMKCFEIGLDAGTAAGIGAGDG